MIWFSAALVLAVALAATPPAQAAFPGANGKIAFTTENPNGAIITMNPDGTSQALLTDGEWPGWSPYGTKIAGCCRASGQGIFTMNADGTGATQLTNGFDADPGWSPDANKIAFERSVGNSEIYTVNADGSSQTNLTNNPASDRSPAWSPNGTKIAFGSDRDGNSEIYTMNAGGTGPTRLTNDAAADEAPDWSPDGTRIAFQTSRHDPNPSGCGGNCQYEIYTMNADGTNQTRLTSNAAKDVHPVWSPDGTKIAFASERDGGPPEIYTMNAPDGSNQTRLTNNSVLDFLPDWQPLRNYARPRGATPKREPLVPAYKQCTTPNTTHQAPLSSPSCNPPTPLSSFLTVGTPDFNGVGANSVGSVLFKVRTTAPEDGLIDVSLTDVRCQGTSGGCAGGALSDYSGELRFDTTFRITDKLNGGVNPSGTVTDLPLRFAVPCTSTASTTVGSTCAISTTKNTVLGPSAIVAGKHAIWQVSGDLKLYDGGSTGVATDPNVTLFAIGGLFFP